MGSRVSGSPLAFARGTCASADHDASVLHRRHDHLPRRRRLYELRRVWGVHVFRLVSRPTFTFHKPCVGTYATFQRDHLAISVFRRRERVRGGEWEHDD